MQLTNRQLMYIISVALVITLFGTAMNLSRLGVGPEGLTGAVTGNVSLTINKVLSFNMTTSNISWGAGVVDSGETSATLDTDGTPYVVNGNWSDTNADGFLIENTGNVDLNITLEGNGSNFTATTFIGGTSPAYKYSVNDEEANSCDDEVSEVAYGLTELAIQICGNHSFVDASDLLSLDFNMTIPYDSLTGYREDVLTITAAQRT